MTPICIGRPMTSKAVIPAPANSPAEKTAENSAESPVNSVVTIIGLGCLANLRRASMPRGIWIWRFNGSITWCEKWTVLAERLPRSVPNRMRNGYYQYNNVALDLKKSAILPMRKYSASKRCLTFWLSGQLSPSSSECLLRYFGARNLP